MIYELINLEHTIKMYLLVFSTIMCNIPFHTSYSLVLHKLLVYDRFLIICLDRLNFQIIYIDGYMSILLEIA